MKFKFQTLEKWKKLLIEYVSALLAAGANPNVTSPGGVSPLMDVCGREYEPETEKLVNFLLMNKADTGMVDMKNRDAVAYARSVGNSNVVRILKKHDQMMGRRKKTDWEEARWSQVTGVFIEVK